MRFITLESNTYHADMMTMNFRGLTCIILKTELCIEIHKAKCDTGRNKEDLDRIQQKWETFNTLFLLLTGHVHGMEGKKAAIENMTKKAIKFS